MEVRAFVIAKNEAANIATSVGSLVAARIPTIVLDSQSADATRELAARAGAVVEDYRYATHAEAYNWITRERTPSDGIVLVLDADMAVSAEMIAEATQLIRNGAQAVRVPVKMCWNGRALRFGSLYPPKAVAFRGGRAHFEPIGHGERLLPGTRTANARAGIVHDDRKPFAAYLNAQERYARNLIRRAASGAVSWRDHVRLRSPLFVLATPLFSYFLRGGILDGRAGLGYALDRLIAEAIMYREGLAARAAVSPIAGPRSD
jgi:hypothetical protein